MWQESCLPEETMLIFGFQDQPFWGHCVLCSLQLQLQKTILSSQNTHLEENMLMSCFLTFLSLPQKRLIGVLTTSHNNALILKYSELTQQDELFT